MWARKIRFELKFEQLHLQSQDDGEMEDISILPGQRIFEQLYRSHSVSWKNRRVDAEKARTTSNYSHSRGRDPGWERVKDSPTEAVGRRLETSLLQCASEENRWEAVQGMPARTGDFTSGCRPRHQERSPRTLGKARQQAEGQLWSLESAVGWSVRRPNGDHRPITTSRT